MRQFSFWCGKTSGKTVWIATGFALAMTKSELGAQASSSFDCTLRRHKDRGNQGGNGRIQNDKAYSRKGGRMNTAILDPIVSEFETAEQEAEHTAWIRAELERRRNDPRPPVPHDEVVCRMEERMTHWLRHKVD
jgi:hypothetical protein